MASNQGYDGQTTGVVAPLTVDQRQRLEAVTFARQLLKGNTLGRSPHFHELIELATYINKGTP